MRVNINCLSLIVIVLAFIWLFNSKALATSNGISFMLVTLNGEIYKYNFTDKTKKKLIQLNSNCVLWSGSLKNNRLYFIENKTQIVTYDLHSLKKQIVFDLKGYLEENMILNSVIPVDNDKYIIVAKLPDFDGDRVFNTIVYKINSSMKKVEKIPFVDYYDGNLSVNEANIFFTGVNGFIYCYDGTTMENMNIKGRYPTVSPDGQKLAYVLTGKIFESLYVLEFKSGKSKKCISFFGPNTISARIRWSDDSQLLSVHQRSDITPKSIQIIKVDESKIIFKIKKVNAHNWFFYRQ